MGPVYFWAMHFLLIAPLLLQIQYGGPPMWDQMPPPEAFNDPRMITPDGAYGPGSIYNAPDQAGPGWMVPPPRWMDNAPPVPNQGPMGPPGRPWGDDGE